MTPYEITTTQLIWSSLVFAAFIIIGVTILILVLVKSIFTRFEQATHESTRDFKIDLKAVASELQDYKLSWREREKTIIHELIAHCQQQQTRCVGEVHADMMNLESKLTTNINHLQENQARLCNNFERYCQERDARWAKIEARNTEIDKRLSDLEGLKNWA